MNPCSLCSRLPSFWASIASAVPSGDWAGGRPHSTVNYVFDHPRSWLAAYHRKVLLEMIRRGYKPDLMWMSLFHRGKHCIADELTKEDYSAAVIKMRKDSLVYPEHNDQYLQECLANLSRKGIEISL